MELRRVTNYIWNLQKLEKFTFSTLKMLFPALKSKRFNEVIRVFINLGFIKKIGRSYICLTNNKDILSQTTIDGLLAGLL